MPFTPTQILPINALTEICIYITAYLYTFVLCWPDRVGQQREQKLINFFPRTKMRIIHAMSNTEVNERNTILAVPLKKNTWWRKRNAMKCFWFVPPPPQSRLKKPKNTKKYIKLTFAQKYMHFYTTEKYILTRSSKIFSKVVHYNINLLFLDTFFCIFVTYCKVFTCRLISAS